MNWFDRYIIRPLSPAWAMRREQARRILNAYEASRPSRLRKNPGDNRSGDGVTAGVTGTLRAQARWLDQNHDLSKGTLSTLVNKVVGQNGIGVEFQPKDLAGNVHKDVAKALQKLFKDWEKRPESTGEYNWPKAQRMMARTWLRDGECLSKSLMGNIKYLQHGTQVPYTLELLEADYLADINDAGRNITQGIERNAWGQPRRYHLYYQHPGDILQLNQNVAPVSADIIDHLKLVDRLRQARGVTLFAAVMNRINDLKDYEESERVAARIAAAMVGYIKKGTPDMYPMDPTSANSSQSNEPRSFNIAPGMMFDNLQPGEEVGTIQSNRPSGMLQSFRDSMLKAFSSGVGAGYSSISRNYDGNYSAQRQELIEQQDNYAVLTNEFIGMFVEPVVRRFIMLARVAGLLDLPSDLDLETLFDVAYITPSMPWIDPQKESAANEKNLALKLTSPQQIIRSRGEKPEDILEQLQRWQQELKDRELVQPPPSQPGPPAGG